MLNVNVYNSDFRNISSLMVYEAKRVITIFDSFINDAAEFIIGLKRQSETDPVFAKQIEKQPLYSGWSYDSTNKKIYKTDAETENHPVYFVLHTMSIYDQLVDTKSPDDYAKRFHDNVNRMSLRMEPFDKIIIDVYLYAYAFNYYGFYLQRDLSHECIHIKQRYESKPDVAYSKVSIEKYKELGLDLSDKEIEYIFSVMYLFEHIEKEPSFTQLNALFKNDKTKNDIILD